MACFMMMFSRSAIQKTSLLIWLSCLFPLMFCGAAPFQILSLEFIPGGEGDGPPSGWELRWESEAGVSYTLERRDSLLSGTWNAVGTMEAQGGISSMRDVLPLQGGKRFWRVIQLTPGGEPLTISDIQAAAELDGPISAALFQITTSGTDTIQSVIFYDDGVPLGNAQPEGNGAWSFTVDWQGANPQIRSLEAEVTTEEGIVRRSALKGFLLADPNQYIPLNEEGALQIGGFIPVDETGQLGPFEFYPEGIGGGADVTGVHIRFPAGARLLPVEEANVSDAGDHPVQDETDTSFSFSEALFYRGGNDLEPVTVNVGERSLPLGRLTPDVIATAFDLPNGAVELCWGDTCVLWEGGTLGDGWSNLSVDLNLGDFGLPDQKLTAQVRFDPISGEFFLTVSYHGSWTPLEDTTFIISEANPLTLYLSRSGEFSAHGAAEARFPGGTTLKGSLSWKDPVFEFSFEGKGISIPALNDLAGKLPEIDAENLVPEMGASSSELDELELKLLGLQQGFRGLVQGSLSQAESSLSLAEPALSLDLPPVRPLHPASAALSGWANMMSSLTTAVSLSPEEVERLGETMYHAGKHAQATDDLEVALRVFASLEQLSNVEGLTLPAQVGPARELALAAVERILSSSAVVQQSAGIEHLFLEELRPDAPIVENLVLAAEESAEVSADPLPISNSQRVTEAYLRKQFSSAYFEAIGVVSGDFDGTDNRKLIKHIEFLPTHELVLGYEKTKKIILDMIFLDKALKRFGTASDAFPMTEAAAQALDALFAYHEYQVNFASTLPEFIAVLDQREELWILHHAFYPNLAEPFSTNTVTLVERFQPVFLAAVKNLPPEKRFQSYFDVVRLLSTFAQRVDSDDLDGYLREHWANLQTLNSFFSLASADTRYCNYLAMELTLNGFQLNQSAESGELSLSGAYDADDVTIVNGIPNLGLDTMTISQAGSFISGRYARRLYSVGTSGNLRKVNIQKLRIRGLLLSQSANSREFAVQLLRANNSVAGYGSFSFVETDGQIRLDTNLEFTENSALLRSFSQVSRQNPISEDIFETFDLNAQRFLEGLHVYPVHQTEYALFQSTFMTYKARIEEYLAINLDLSDRKEQIVNELNTLSEFVRRQLPEFAQIHYESYMTTRLQDQVYEPEGEAEKSYWDWLFFIINEQKFNDDVSFDQISDVAQLPSVNVAQFIYELNFYEASLGLGVGAILQASIQEGTLLIRVDKKTTDNVLLDQFNVAVRIGKITGGAAISIPSPIAGGLTSSAGVIRSSQSYQAEDFEGYVIFSDMSLTLGLDGGVNPFGSMYFSGLNAYADTSGTFDVIALPEVSAGLTIGGGIVYAGWDAENPSPSPEERFTVPDNHIPYSSSADSRVDRFLHFEEGGFTINECGMQYLREFVAEYRFLFEDPEADIQILGFTDPKGAADPAELGPVEPSPIPGDNLTLSQYRAEAVHEALRVILDIEAHEAFIPANKIQGLGEGPARDPAQGNIPDGQVAPEWRKVEIILNNRVTLRLSAADLTAQ